MYNAKYDSLIFELADLDRKRQGTEHFVFSYINKFLSTLLVVPVRSVHEFIIIICSYMHRFNVY